MKRFTSNTDRYYELKNKPLREKYLEGNNVLLPYLFEDQKSLINLNMFKKSNERVENKSQVKEFLESISEKKSRKNSPLERRVKNLSSLLEDLNKNEDIYKDAQKIKERIFDNEDTFIFYSEILFNKNSLDVESFLESHTQKEVMNFVIENFGYDFKSKFFRTRQFDSISENEWKEYNSKINYGRLQNHIANAYLIQARQYEHTKILKVEIDNRKFPRNLKSYLTLGEFFKIITKEFGVEPFYVERSLQEKGLMRAFYTFDNYVSDTHKRKLENFFSNKYGFTCRIQTSEEYMTLPFSKEILMRGRYSSENPLSIQHETLEETYQRVSNHSLIGKTRSIENMIGKLVHGEVIEKDTDILTENESSNTEYKTHGSDKFSYGAGTRFKNQVSLAVWCFARGCTFQEYFNLALSLDGGSKDMMKWSLDRKQKVLLGYWNFANGHATKIETSLSVKKNGTFTLSADGKKQYSICDTQIPVLLDTRSEKDKFLFIVSHFYNTEYTSSRQQGRWKTIFLEDSLKLYKFLQRKQEYEELSGKEYTEEKFKELNKGVLLPHSMYKDLKKHLGIRTDMRRLIRLLEKAELLRCIEIDGYEFSYKDKTFGRHYRLIEKSRMEHIYTYIQNTYYNTVIINSNIYRGVLSSSINYSSYVCFGNVFSEEEKGKKPPSG
jgi:hypothetical protein